MTEEIVTIRLAGINNGAHYNFMSNVAEKAKGDEAVYGKAKLQTDALVSALAQENEDLMLSRKSSLSDTIAEADRQRDAYYRGYRNGVRSFRSFPAGAQKTAADMLWQHMTDHGIEPKMQLDRETGLLTNLVEDLQGRLAPQVAALGLKPFVDGMKAANETVRTSLSGRDTEQSGLTLGALKASRAKTDEAYQSLVRRVNAHAEIEGAGDYFAFITYVNEQARAPASLRSRSSCLCSSLLSRQLRGWLPARWRMPVTRASCRTARSSTCSTWTATPTTSSG